MVRSAFLLSVFFVAGIVLGVFLGSQMGSSSREPAVQDPQGELEVSPAASATAPDATRDMKVVPTLESADGQAVRVPRVTYRQLEEALAAIPAPEYEEGQATISGHVRDEEENPVPGVLIRAVGSKLRKKKSSDRNGAPRNHDMTSAVLDRVSEYYWDKATTTETETHRDGAYTLTGLRSDQRYTVEAYKKGWKIDRAPGHDRQEQLPGGVIDFVAAAVVGVPVNVAFLDGTQPYKAKIDWRASGTIGSERWFPHDPVIELRPGIYEVTARAGDENEYASEALEISVDVGDKVPELSFLVQTRPGVRGRLVFPKGEEADQAKVYILRYEDSPADSEDLEERGQSEWVYRRNNFEFAFNDLPPGTYLLGGSRYRKQIVTMKTITVAEELVATNLSIPALEFEEYIVLWVYDPDGNVLTDASVSVSCRSGGRYDSGRGFVIERKDGSYWVIHGETDTSRAEVKVLCFLSVYVQEYGRQRVEFSASESVEVTVKFPEPAHLDVTIAGYNGSGYEGLLRVSLRKLDTEGGSRSSYSPYSSKPGMDFQRQQSFGPLEPGDYEIVLSMKSARSGNRPLQKVPITLQAGENSAWVSIPPLYSLTVIVSDGAPRKSVYIRLSSRAGGRGSPRMTDENGQAHFEHLPAGEYKISALAAGFSGEMLVEIPRQSVVTFEAKQ